MNTKYRSSQQHRRPSLTPASGPFPRSDAGPGAMPEKQPHQHDALHERITLTRRETARALGIGLTRLDEILKSRELPCIRLGRSTLIRSADLQAFVASLPPAR